MATKQKSNNNPTDWENPNSDDAQQWESASSGGFAPLWKPEQGESVIVQVLGVEPFKVKKQKGKKVKDDMQPSFAIHCTLRGGSLANFFKNKTTHADVKYGEDVTLGSSYNLCGEDKLVVIDRGSARLSKMAELLLKDGQSFRVVFNGKIKTDGARSVNDFTVQFPKGYKDKLVKF
jgi:hypothetical protein